MGFSDRLLAEGADIWDAQRTHPFVTELADGTLEEAAFQYWIEQDYLYLLDYARVFALAGARASEEQLMTELQGVAHETLDTEMDLHRAFAEEYGRSRTDLEAVEKAPTTQAYTDFLVRTAYEGSLAELSAALYPCEQGFLDVAAAAAERAEGEHRYTPWIDLYTSETFHEVVDQARSFVDRMAERNPGEREAMREAFMTSARWEYEFWTMAYRQEAWSI